MNRLFVSYRSADGKKDADRLAADLGRMFGDEQVFFDKHDLQGGASWRESIARTIGGRPVVLLVVTPGLFAARDAAGQRCIERESDPVRGELLAAQGAGALLVPLLTEGAVMPAVAELPPELRFVAEAHALRLRTDDWAHDFQRLLADLGAQGVVPARGTAAPRRAVGRRHAVAGGALAVALAMAGAYFGWRRLGGDAAPGGASKLGGVWWLVDAEGRRTRATIAVRDGVAELTTEGIAVASDPGWLAYAERMKRDHGLAIEHIVYRAKGEAGDRGLDLALAVYGGRGDGPLDTGNLRLQASADGRELVGSLWSNGDQASSPVRLVRK